jgi:hypothetical protein
VEACTCAVTEYHYHNRDDFIVNVDLFTHEEIMTQVTQLLESYCSFHLSQDDGTDPQHRENLQKQARFAVDRFREIFGTRLGDEAFLTADPKDVVLNKFRLWVEPPTRLAGSNTMQTLQQAREFLAQLSSVRQNSATGNSVSPYIKKIQCVTWP